MTKTRPKTTGPPTAEVVDFDRALLAMVPSEERAELIAEAALLAHAFAPEGRTEEILAMAATLAAGARDEEMDPARARRLATALRCLDAPRPGELDVLFGRAATEADLSRRAEARPRVADARRAPYQDGAKFRRQLTGFVGFVEQGELGRLEHRAVADEP